MANQIVNGKFLNNDTFAPFQSSGGLVHSCNNYYSLVQKAGGNKLEKDNMGISYETAFGGKPKKSKKSSKKSKKSSKKPKKSVKKPKKSSKKSKKSIVKKTMNGVKRIKNMIMSKISSMKKKRSKKQKGGQESSGATPMNMRFFNPNAHLDNMSANSGMGVNSAYGPIDPKDVGVGMLAPYTTSTSKTANHSSGQQTGGRKKSKGKKGKSMMNKIMKKMSNIKKSILPGSKKKKSKKSKKQRGGDGNELPGYDASDKLAIYDSKQKGGKDLLKKMSPNPIIKAQKISNKMIDDAVNVLNDMTSAYNKSIKDAENIKIGNQRLIQGGAKAKSKKSKTKKSKKASSKKVKKSSKKVKKSSKKPKKSSKKVSKSSKKASKKPKKAMKKHKGGDGSDFALTLASRGPANAPDKYWGVDGETWFRQFNKTGQYIPNSRLAQAATPQLVSGPNNNIVMGYDDMGIGSSLGNA
jgi:outer membrane biosynthesis protein TonB